MEKRIAVIVAMETEHRQIEVSLEDKVKEKHGMVDYTVGRLGNNRIILLQCGIGKVNAAACTADLIYNYHPDYIISTGVAGGLDESLDMMDVVVSTETCQHDVWCGPGTEPGQVQGLPRRFTADKSLLDKALSLHTDTRIVAGLIATGDQFIDDEGRQKAIKAVFPDTMAVDMESGSIAQVCHIYHVPFISFRIISDVPGKEARFKLYTDFWKQMADTSFNVTRQFLCSL